MKVQMLGTEHNPQESISKEITNHQVSWTELVTNRYPLHKANPYAMAAAPLTPPQIQELALSLQRLGTTNGLLQPMYSIVQMQGRGQGFRTQCDIPRGTLILADRPLFSVNAVEDPHTRANKTQIQLGANQHPQFATLYCPGGQQALAPRRFEVNSFQMSPLDERGSCTQGIFLEAARINHSCLPNAHFAWNETLNRLTIYAIHDILNGDEILINYRLDDCYKPARTRRLKLRQIYDFNCMCVACDRSTTLGRASETRRDQMRQLDEYLTWSRAPDRRLEVRPRAELSDYFGRMLNLLEQECLYYPKLAEVYGWAAEWFDRERTQTHDEGVVDRSLCRPRALAAARKMLDLDVTATGHNSSEVQHTLNVIETHKR